MYTIFDSWGTEQYNNIVVGVVRGDSLQLPIYGAFYPTLVVDIYMMLNAEYE